nr:FHA domain-containing protein [Deltaproteobacteria bacterium]
VCAGQQWMCYEAGRDGLPHRVHQLDAEGNTRMTLCVRGTTLSVGRTAGDVVIPCDDTMSALHFQVLVRGEAAFVQDLASETGTWVIVRPGEVLPSGSFLAVGDRLLCVSTPPPFEAEPTPPEPSWRTSLYAYAHAAA